MNIKEILEVVEGKLVTTTDISTVKVERAFTSDLMSDVLTISNAECLCLLTGLANVQTIRTAEMAGLSIIVLVRGKKATQDMIEIAQDNDIVIIETKFSAFLTSALLYNSGVKSLY